MTFCDGLMKFIVVLVNLLLALVWAGIFIVGAILAWGQNVAINILTQYMQGIMTKLSEQTGGQVNLNTMITLVQQVGTPLGIGIFVVGLILFITCISAAFGVICKVRFFMIIYAVMMFILIILQIALVIIFFANRGLIFNPIQTYLTQTITLYQGFSATNAESLLWNLLQPPMSCCGVNSYTDFSTATNYNFQETYEGKKMTVQAPIACCKFTSSYALQYGTACATSPSTTNSNYQNGCFTMLQAIVQYYAAAFAGVIIALIIFETTLVAMAIAIYVSWEK